MPLTTPAFFWMSLRVTKRLRPGNQNSIQSMEKSGVTSTEEGKASEKQHEVNVGLFFDQKGIVHKGFVSLVKQLMLHSTSKFWNVYGRMCEGSDLISGAHGCSTMTMRQSMLPSWLDGFWPIITWQWGHILPTRSTLHPATFSNFQNWKWSLRSKDFRHWRKFKQSRKPSWTRYEKMTFKNASNLAAPLGSLSSLRRGLYWRWCRPLMSKVSLSVFKSSIRKLIDYPSYK